MKKTKLSTYVVAYRYRTAAGKLMDTVDYIEAPSLAAAKRLAKSVEGTDRATWLVSVEPVRGTP